MKLSQETVIGLKRLCNKSLIPNEVFDDLLEKCVQLIIHESPSDEKKFGLDTKLDAVKAAHASLLVLYTEGARHDVDSFMLKTILEEYNINSERVVPISDKYATYRTLARQRLQIIGTNLPHIVDVRWRMDFSVKEMFSGTTLLRRPNHSYFLQCEKYCAIGLLDSKSRGIGSFFEKCCQTLEQVGQYLEVNFDDFSNVESYPASFMDGYKTVTRKQFRGKFFS